MEVYITNHFDIGSYIEIVKDIIDGGGDFEVMSLFLGTLPKYDISKFTKDKMSEIKHHNENVQNEIKSVSSKIENHNLIVNEFNNVIIKKINIQVADEACEKIIKLIKLDTDIVEKKKKEIIDLYKYNDLNSICRFLAETFIYALSRNNKIEEEFDNNNILLLIMSNHRCSNCNKLVYDNIKGTQVEDYEIVDIYKKEFKKDEEFNEIKVSPKEIKSLSNKIVLCKNCAKEYSTNTTLKEYKKLLDKKKHQELEYETNDTIRKLPLADEIIDVLEALKTNDLPKKISHSENLVLKNINDKMNDPALIKTQRDYAKTNFYAIRTIFNKMDRTNSKTFQGIKIDINRCYSKLVKVYSKNGKKDESEIIEHIVEWILDQSKLEKNKYRNACYAIVSFFIYICEVFGATSE